MMGWAYFVIAQEVNFRIVEWHRSEFLFRDAQLHLAGQLRGNFL